MTLFVQVHTVVGVLYCVVTIVSCVGAPVVWCTLVYCTLLFYCWRILYVEEGCACGGNQSYVKWLLGIVKCIVFQT